MSKLRILSNRCDAFPDRCEAGRLLGEQLKEFRGKNAVVLGIPRGGIVVAREMVDQIQAELDIIIARKLRAPMQPELAVGAVTEDGSVFFNDDVMASIGVSRRDLEREIEIQVAEIARRKEMIRAVLPKVNLKGRTVVVTDDGVATGATTQAALWAIRREEPAYLIAAIPVGAAEAVNRLNKDADEFVCLCVPAYFSAVGQFYSNFEEIDDLQVLRILTEKKERKAASRP